MTEKIQFIPARLKNAAVGGHVAGSEDVIDERMNMTQNDVNSTFQTAINALDGQNYVTVETYASLPATGAVNTIYRVSNYDGAQSQVDATKYSEYAWNGSTYVLLDVKSQIGEVYDISAAHSGQTYADLAAALDGGNNVPEGIRKGGMSIKFVQTSDNKYVQYRYMGTDVTGSPNPFLDTDNWAICDDNIIVEDQVFVKLEKDNDGKVIQGVKRNGKVFIPELESPSINSFINKQIMGVRKEIRETVDEESDIENRIAITLDKEGKIVSYRKSDGTLVEPRLQVEELILGEKAKKSVKNAVSTETVIVVDKGGEGDYTSLLEAVMASQGIGKCTIIVNSGEYDLISEYKAVFGNDYFDNYAANYNGYKNGRIDAGLFLWPDVSLKGNGFVRIKFDYQGSNTNVKTYFAPINTTNNVVVEDITITTNEDMCCRYLIHDDFAQGAGVNIFRNIVFDGNSNGGSIIGAGMGVANTYIVENCYFMNEATFDDINYHNNGSASTTYENLLMVRNCKGGGKCVVQSLGNSDKMTKCIVSNSEFTQILSRRSSMQTYDKDNMELIKFLNNETNV